MKRAGDVLSVIFDERLMKKAEGYSRLFSYWAEAVKKNGIAPAADHSRIKELDQGILLIETDHPGWKQIIQTKQGMILNDFRRSFPDLEISGISLMLGRTGPQSEEPAPAAPSAAETSQISYTASPEAGYDAIKDEAFKETLKRLERSIAACYTENIENR
jgi:hypothetical protein